MDRPGADADPAAHRPGRPDRTTACGPRRSSARTAWAAPSPRSSTASCARKGCTYGVRAFGQVLRSTRRARARRCWRSTAPSTRRTPAPPSTTSGRCCAPSPRRASRTRERDAAVHNLVGVAPLRYETAAAVAGTLADQVEQHLPDDFQAELYRRLGQTGTVEATGRRWSAPSRRTGSSPSSRRGRRGHQGAGRSARHRRSGGRLWLIDGLSRFGHRTPEPRRPAGRRGSGPTLAPVRFWWGAWVSALWRALPKIRVRLVGRKIRRIASSSLSARCTRRTRGAGQRSPRSPSGAGTEPGTLRPTGVNPADRRHTVYGGSWEDLPAPNPSS